MGSILAQLFERPPIRHSAGLHLPRHHEPRVAGLSFSFSGVSVRTSGWLRKTSFSLPSGPGSKVQSQIATTPKFSTGFASFARMSFKRAPRLLLIGNVTSVVLPIVHLAPEASGARS